MEEIRKKEIRNALEKIIEEEFDKKVDVLCDPNYYKNQYLEYAIKHHTSAPCIYRTYAEALKSGMQYSHDKKDIKHLNNLVNYIKVYSDDEDQDFINHLFAHDIKHMVQEKIPYLIASKHGRFKSGLSAEVNFREKLLTEEILGYLKENLCAIQEASNFLQEADYELANEILSEMQLENNQKNMINDIIGYRIIVDSVDSSRDEDKLISCIYKLAHLLIEFFENSGYDIHKIKDYIKNPKKDTGYQSYHILVMIGHTKVEIQLRTARMHKEAEEGAWSHDEIYKNTKLYNFLKDFLYKVSKAEDKVSINERIGLLKSMHLSNKPWCFSPTEEIPKNPTQVKDFADTEFLKSVFGISK